MKKIRVIKIDVENKSVYETEIRKDNIDDIYEKIGAEFFTTVQIVENPNGSCELMYVDDEGLLRENKLGAFKIGNDLKISGNAIICGTTSRGEGMSTKMSVEEVKSIVQFIDISELPVPTFKIYSS